MGECPRKSRCARHLDSWLAAHGGSQRDEGWHSREDGHADFRPQNAVHVRALHHHRREGYRAGWRKLEAFEKAEKEVRAKVRAVGQKAAGEAEAGNGYKA